MTNAMTIERLTEFAESWNTHDPDKVASYFAENGEFHGPIGPDHLGHSNVGREAVRQAAATFFAAAPHGRFTNLRVRLYGDRGVFEWDFENVDEAGNTSSVAGCDLLTFEGDEVAFKSVYLKRQAGQPLVP